MNTSKRILQAILLAAGIMASLTFVAAAENPVHTITVDVLVNNEYDDSEESLQTLRELLRLGFFEQVELGPSESIEEYMFRRYEFGPSQLPKSFALLMATIYERNKDRSKSDHWLIPSLPRRRKTELNPNNPYYQLPRVATFDVVGKVNGGFTVQQEGTTEERSRLGSKYTLLQYTMPREFYDSLSPEVRSLPIIKGVSRQFAPLDMPETPAYTAPPPPSYFEVYSTPQTRGSGSSLAPIDNSLKEEQAPLDAPPTSDLDSAPFFEPSLQTENPDADFVIPAEPSPEGELDAFISLAPAMHSITPMANISDAPPQALTWKLLDSATQASLRLDQRFATAKRPTYLFVLDDGWPNEKSMKDSISFIETVLNRRRPSLGVENISLSVPASVNFKNHSAEVHTSLEELDKVATPNPVKTLYIPVLLDESTEDMIEELLTFEYLLRYLPQNFAKPIPKPNPMEESARDWAASEITAWKKAKQWTGDPFSTHAYVLNAIYRLGESVAAAEKTIFVVNQSWTVRGNILSLAPTSRSLTVAATGNDGVDVLASNIDFAQRSAHDDGFLAVMYINSNGKPDCGSGFITEKDEIISNVRVVAYNGELANGHCGTSFAAPRVAWFLAAKSALMDQYTDDWQKRLQDTLKSIRPGGERWKNIYFDVVRFWQ